MDPCRRTCSRGEEAAASVYPNRSCFGKASRLLVKLYCRKDEKQARESCLIYERGGADRQAETNEGRLTAEPQRWPKGYGNDGQGTRPDNYGYLDGGVVLTHTSLVYGTGIKKKPQPKPSIKKPRNPHFERFSVHPINSSWPRPSRGQHGHVTLQTEEQDFGRQSHGKREVRLWDTFPTLARNGKVEVFESFDLSGAFPGCRPVLVGFEESRERQPRVRGGRSPVVTVVGRQRPAKEIPTSCREGNPAATALWKGACEVRWSK
ncbi:uncharacterized protein LOC115339235 [Aquila chrysaetos chrysaetos]|uniref:uncharacterized protein LOC115339235 n=1 Tax=Aquila chrysaetos chrysaetos TaxID=223781 RepID=UPI00117664C5|nr:uncharacterized protein LOC115339235 [Aquila chrysaetos chrysaetos]XP_029864767.1 uncharacterized protein LOC115339235 [Aquila chrysaetos chrysaetos]